METPGSDNLQQELFNKICSSRRHTFSLRMAPMIDMIFLLLIFFLVAAKWRPEEDFLPLRLPVAHAQDRRFAKPEPLVIHILAAQGGCEVRISGQPLAIRINNKTIEADLATLAEKLRQCLLQQKRYASDPVEIICAPAVKWQHLAKIYNLFYGAALSDITFTMTEPGR